MTVLSESLSAQDRAVYSRAVRSLAGAVTLLVVFAGAGCQMPTGAGWPASVESYLESHPSVRPEIARALRQGIVVTGMGVGVESRSMGLS